MCANRRQSCVRPECSFSFLLIARQLIGRTLCPAGEDQRCGPTVHFHSVIPDGVFVRERGAVHFVPLGAPPEGELEAILQKLVVRLLRLLRPRAEGMDSAQTDALATAQAEAILLPSGSAQDPPRRRRHAAFLEGFSLHAGVHLHANDREGLERLCGY